MNDVASSVIYSQTPLEGRLFPGDFVNHIVNGDCVSVMRHMPDECIDLVITSPPYFVQKNYEKTWTFEKYNTLMSAVFVECFRLLKPAKYLVINFGDYFNKDRFYKSEIPSVFPASINFFEWGREVGFDLQATRIWRKQFGRMSIPFVCNTHPRPIFDYEHVWTFRKPGNDGEEFVNDRKKSQKGVIGDGWSQSAELGNHEAAFPVDLPFWAIDVYSRERNDVVLDPFCGIASTLIASAEKGRQYIGLELDRGCCELGYRRMSTPRAVPRARPKTRKSMSPL